MMPYGQSAAFPLPRSGTGGDGLIVFSPVEIPGVQEKGII